MIEADFREGLHRRREHRQRERVVSKGSRDGLVDRARTAERMPADRQELCAGEHPREADVVLVSIRPVDVDRDGHTLHEPALLRDHGIPQERLENGRCERACGRGPIVLLLRPVVLHHEDEARHGAGPRIAAKGAPEEERNEPSTSAEERGSSAEARAQGATLLTNASWAATSAKAVARGSSTRKRDDSSRTSA